MAIGEGRSAVVTLWDSEEAREASRINFENQFGEFMSGRREFINALQAITDWGNAVSQESRSITQYNTELADVERQTGTILETHGIRFFEERYGSLGPIGLLGFRRSNKLYPSATRLTGSDDRYQESTSSSDEAFELEDLDTRRESKPKAGVDSTLDKKPESGPASEPGVAPKPGELDR